MFSQTPVNQIKLWRAISSHVTFISQHLLFAVHYSHKIERIALKFIFGNQNTLFKNVRESVFSKTVVVKQRKVHVGDAFALGVLIDAFLSGPNQWKEISDLNLAIYFIFNNLCENNIIFWQKIMANVILTHFIFQFVFLLLLIMKF